MEREDSAILDIHRRQDVGHERQRRGVADQPCIAVNHHHAGVLGPAHQHPQLAAGIADCFGFRQLRIAWQPFVDPGQLPAGYVLFEKRRLLELGLDRAGNGYRESHEEAHPLHIEPPYRFLGLSFYAEMASLARAAIARGDALASTQWPGPISMSGGEFIGSRRNGSGQAAGSEALSSIS